MAEKKSAAEKTSAAEKRAQALSRSSELTPLQRAVIDFEAQWQEAVNTRTVMPTAKSRYIYDQLAISAPLYHAVLNQALTKPEAIRDYPALVAQLLRMRDQRSRERGE